MDGSPPFHPNSTHEHLRKLASKMVKDGIWSRVLEARHVGFVEQAVASCESWERFISLSYPPPGWTGPIRGMDDPPHKPSRAQPSISSSRGTKRKRSPSGSVTDEDGGSRDDDEPEDDPEDSGRGRKRIAKRRKRKASRLRSSGRSRASKKESLRESATEHSESADEEADDGASDPPPTATVDNHDELERAWCAMRVRLIVYDELVNWEQTRVQMLARAASDASTTATPPKPPLEDQYSSRYAADRALAYVDDMFHTLEADAEDWEAYMQGVKDDKASLDSQSHENQSKDSDSAVVNGTSTPSQSAEGEDSSSKVKEEEGEAMDVEQAEEAPSVVKPIAVAPSPEISAAHLYKALRNVLAQLKAYREHSEPFLSRVRKVQAPTYYDVIKRPMDLSAMSRKLERTEYMCKGDFQADLDLIYSNCREFNGDESIYTHHAMKLEELSIILMRDVPDVHLEQLMDISQHKRRPGRPRRSSHSAHKEDAVDAAPPSSTPSAPPPPPPTPPPDRLPLFDAVELDAYLHTSDPVEEAWKATTRNHRMHRLKYRHLERKKPLEEREGIMRSGERMACFYRMLRESEEGARPPVGLETSSTMAVVRAGLPLERAPSGPQEPLPQAYCPELGRATDSVPGLPDLTPLCGDHDARVVVSRRHAGHAIKPSLVEHNIGVLHKVRELRHRVLLSTGLPSLPPPEPVDPIPGVMTRTVMNRRFNSEMIRKCVCVLLAHAGFDSVTSMALDVLVEVLEAYIVKFGAVLHINEDSLRFQTRNELLAEAMRVMGIRGVSELQKYVEDGLVRHNANLLAARDKFADRLTALGAANAANANRRHRRKSDVSQKLQLELEQSIAELDGLIVDPALSDDYHLELFGVKDILGPSFTASKKKNGAAPRSTTGLVQRRPTIMMTPAQPRSGNAPPAPSASTISTSSTTSKTSTRSESSRKVSKVKSEATTTKKRKERKGSSKKRSGKA